MGVSLLIVDSTEEIKQDSDGLLLHVRFANQLKLGGFEWILPDFKYLFPYVFNGIVRRVDRIFGKSSRRSDGKQYTIHTLS